MTDLEGLENLRIPSDLTKEQVYEMFRRVHILVWHCQRRYSHMRIAEDLEALKEWFMKQNFQDQIQPTNPVGSNLSSDSTLQSS